MKLYDMQQEPAQSQYRGCGWAWVAIKDDQIIAVRYMDNHTGSLTSRSPEVLKRADRKRDCMWSRYVAREMNRERFLEWRTKAKTELAKLGEVRSGMMSCYQFYPNVKYSTQSKPK